MLLPRSSTDASLGIGTVEDDAGPCSRGDDGLERCGVSSKQQDALAVDAWLDQG